MEDWGERNNGSGGPNWRKVRGIRTRVRESAGLVAVAVVLATLLVLAVWVLPSVLTGKGEAENDVRATLLQGLAGLVLATGLYFTAQTLRLNRESAARTYRLEREGQITERFTRAIDQIGRDRPDEVRLGGIYALERIARESEDDHGPIMEVLTAYVREHARWPAPAADADEGPSAEDRAEDRPVSTDAQAVIAVLGRRKLGRQEHDLNLSSAHLRQARFAKGPDEGHFEKAILRGAHLEDAELVETLLTEANLAGASLTGKANLAGADLTGANLTGANFTGKANLTGAKLTGADLTGAKLIGADLTGADLTRATLTGATLTGTDLRGATFTGANLVDADLADSNLDGANLAGENLSGATLAGASLRGTVLKEAALGKATLTGADLREANLTGAFLSDANLAEAKLWEADFAGATLWGANFTGVKYLKSANLTAAEYNWRTTWPESFDQDAAGAEEATLLEDL
jgi:uncharacterized protein YjbI with pentapeptide repeats